ncbi:hypothetical protein BCR32DRAFT_292861 [Anaeromyces robustus]|uniref:Mitochondrial genome maintenance protein Mgr2 n=1 Tax=Anaeromyces robustus TaxID=1754192 RepID=A0A1Y1X8Q7_9FUNG|nr:hypothetical protein BCR32DRAFT_292861 [Anaeromyces robustus]|eukprot:ORX82099.1 hypothetical protein BCR32DRAFT_292861 [Anaeromyces robustus]
MVEVESSNLEKFSRGALSGASVGLCLGFIYGTYNVLRVGPGNGSITGTIAKSMGASAASFGFFMGIGSLIRSEGRKLPTTSLINDNYFNKSLLVKEKRFN